MKRRPAKIGPGSHRRRGFALVFVLGIIVLVLVVALAFLLRSTTERSAAGGYASLTAARQLGDMAIGIVQGQINHASTRGSTVCWTSQPGMVRTFDSTGNLLLAYKLYSADDLVVTDVGISSGKSPDEPPPDWAGNTATWVDLNAPVTVNGISSFPILDSTTAANGFGISSVPGATSAQPAPMPVKWLYVLQDGKVVAPLGGAGTTADIPGETAANPVIGRIAFWTDDESCRVNINTASAGAYWATPRASGNQERDLASYQPANREFQRYPGHPATVDLRAVFPSLTADQIYSLVPRVVGGGSNQGSAIASGALTPDSDRLYASIDELFFAADAIGNNRPPEGSVSVSDIRKARFLLTAHSRAPETNLFNLPRIATWPIYRLGSNGMPDSSHTTAFDRLVELCSSTGEIGQSTFHAYLFQRENAGSPTNDIGISRNQDLYKYLQSLTSQSVPGFGPGTISGKYGSDRDQILTQIFDYIRSFNLYDDFLSTGNQFTQGRGAATQSALTGHGWVVPSYDSATDTMGFGRAYTLSELAIGFICNAVADDSSTTGTDESNGSNNPATNRVLGASALNTGEKYIQAVILPELFSPMMGWTAMVPDLRVRIKGLENLSVVDGDGVSHSLFPVLADTENYTTFSQQVTAMIGARYWGGNPAWRYFGWNGSPKGSSARGSLPGDSGTTYPFIGIPVKIKAPATTGTMEFKGGELTVEFYAGASAIPSSTNLIQTIQVGLPDGIFPIPNLVTAGTTAAGTTSATTKENWWAYSLGGAIAGSPGRLNFIHQSPGSGPSAWRAGAFFLPAYDVVRSVLPKHGDYRLVAASREVPNTVFAKHPKYDDTTLRMASNLTGSISTLVDPGYDTGGKYISTLTYSSAWTPDIPSNATGTNTPETSGDYDTGLPGGQDGPYVNKPDEGNTYRETGGIPYFGDGSIRQGAAGQTFFSPNRQVPSSGMFGSLPSGVKSGTPWQTLLFRNQSSHPQSTTSRPAFPADHLIMDLFWMPVVEPYAISDRFSTAGKINLNYQILPFTYIQRSTAMRALLSSERVAAISNSLANTYKNAAATSDEIRFRIEDDETLSQFQSLFVQGKVFRAASEICDLHIIPQGESAASMAAYWNTHALTGDNLRELIYTTIYPRLTTKSNTYTVYFRAQSLKKVPGSPRGAWTEGKDIITGEYRGSTTIERFINAADPGNPIPDYAPIPAGKDTLDAFYKWRVVENKQFAP